ncbi:MAG: YegS/Rv2252/BmrU family lipid kinase [Bacteroidetes bacterium]|nr:YegS/Rv2252/BmrU family lipid kinase [Bacteroidota bacterium]
MKKALLISNPVAGKGKPLQSSKYIYDFLKNKGFDIVEYQTRYKNDIEGINVFFGKNINSDLLIISGGDGTLNDVVNAIPENFNTPVLILPLGSGNDFANCLYNKKSLTQILELCVKNTPKPVNIGICNGKKFINGIGIGFDGWVAQKANEGVKYIPVILKYYTAILRGIFTFSSFETNLGKALIIAVANGPTYGGGFKIAPGAVPDDDYFDLWIIKPIKFFKRIFYLNLIKKGLHKSDISTFEHKKIKDLKIICNKPVPAHLDGEYIISDVFDVQLCAYKLFFLV